MDKARPPFFHHSAFSLLSSSDFSPLCIQFVIGSISAEMMYIHPADRHGVMCAAFAAGWDEDSGEVARKILLT